MFLVSTKDFSTLGVGWFANACSSADILEMKSSSFRLRSLNFLMEYEIEADLIPHPLPLVVNENKDKLLI